MRPAIVTVSALSIALVSLAIACAAPGEDAEPSEGPEAKRFTTDVESKTVTNAISSPDGGTRSTDNSPDGRRW